MRIWQNSLKLSKGKYMLLGICFYKLRNIQDKRHAQYRKWTLYFIFVPCRCIPLFVKPYLLLSFLIINVILVQINIGPFCFNSNDGLYFHLTEKAKELASKVGGEAMTLAELENFHPEDGMILANTTSVGMKPNIDNTPLSKVCLLLFLILNVMSSECRV